MEVKRRGAFDVCFSVDGFLGVQVLRSIVCFTVWWLMIEY